jgi:hypothetical protein
LSAAAPQAMAQSVPATDSSTYWGMPQVIRNPKGVVAPQNGTAEEAYIKEKIRGAGYSGVNSLVRDKEGTWYARAYKGPADVVLAVDRSGHISETKQQVEGLN